MVTYEENNAGKTQIPVLARENIGGCKRLENHNILITAGTLGIGRAIVERCLQEGGNVFLCSRKQKNVDDTVTELRNKYGVRVDGCVCNVGKKEDQITYVNKAVDFFSKINKIDKKSVTIQGVVSNAAINPVAGPSLNLSTEVYEKIMNTNVQSYWELIKIVNPFLAVGSSILFISSVGGLQPATPVGIYTMSKTAVISLTRVLSQELGQQNIRVNCIAPGVIRTKMSELFWKTKNENGISIETGEFQEEKKQNTSLPRFGDPEDIAGAAAFFLSQDSAYITGETLVISGGVNSRL